MTETLCAVVTKSTIKPLARPIKKEDWTRNHYKQEFLEQLHKNTVAHEGGTVVQMWDETKQALVKKAVVTTGDAQTDDLIRTFVGPLGKKLTYEDGSPRGYQLVKAGRQKRPR